MEHRRKEWTYNRTYGKFKFFGPGTNFYALIKVLLLDNICYIFHYF